MSLPHPAYRLSVSSWINLGLLAALLVGLTLFLWPHWVDNPDLSHGYFMPLLFLLLLHESRTRGARRYLPGHPAVLTVEIVLLVLGLVALAAGSLFAAAVGWSAALVAFVLTSGAVLLFSAALCACSREDVRFIPFNWTALTAVGLWLLCTPMPPGTYSRLTLGLQLSVSQHVLSLLHLLGIPARLQGNIIELAHTSVGVEEACSGVRSLLSCIFAGFFFSATLVRQPWKRGLIIGLAAPLALLMNLIRSLTLTLLANRGVDIAGLWHDLTGYAVLGVTAVLLGGLALRLETRETPPAATTAAPPSPAAHRQPAPQIALGTGLVLCALLGWFFVQHTVPSAPAQAAAPDVRALLPSQAAGWQVVDNSRELYRFTGTLLTQDLAQLTYIKQTADGVIQLTVYLAYWRPGQAPVSQVAMHTPDACWPGAGWVAAPVLTPLATLRAGDQVLPAAEARFFRHGGYPQYVWFWHLMDSKPLQIADPRSPWKLLRLAWRYGFQRDGSQLFVRVSSNQPWSAFQDDPLLADIFKQLRPLGL